jgi:Arc/MetJ-type ribon-helix-helix transcriptional regulator
MSELQIHLPEPISEFAGAQVSSGRFPTISDYLGALVVADEKAQRVIGQLSENPQLNALLTDGMNSEPGRRWSDSVLNELKHQVRERAAGKNT